MGGVWSRLWAARPTLPSFRGKAPLATSVSGHFSTAGSAVTTVLTYERQEQLPCCCDPILRVKRRVPRCMYFYIVMIIILGICSAWVVPMTQHAIGMATNSAVLKQCFMLYDSTPNNLTTSDATLAMASSNGKINIVSTAKLGCPSTNQKGELKNGTDQLADPTLENFMAALPGLQDYVSKQVVPDPTAHAFWSRNLPDMHFLGSAATLMPQGTITPGDGVMSALLTWHPTSNFPEDVPRSRKAVLNKTTGLEEYDVFEVTWTVYCNDQSASCSSRDCKMLQIKCNQNLIPLPDHPLSMYPFDKYQFAVEIRVQALVQSMKYPENTFTIGVPFHLTLQSFSPSWAFKYDGPNWYSDMYSKYIFPVYFNHGLSEAFDVRLPIQMRRNFITQGWCIMLVVLMWLLSLGMFITAVDFVLLRPRDTPATMALSAIGMVWAIPGVRNNMPGVPPVGIVLDYAGFFWNVVLAGMAAVMLLGSAYSDYKRGETHRKKRSAESSKGDKEGGDTMTQSMRNDLRSQDMQGFSDLAPIKSGFQLASEAALGPMPEGVMSRAGTLSRATAPGLPSNGSRLSLLDEHAAELGQCHSVLVSSSSSAHVAAGPHTQTLGSPTTTPSAAGSMQKPRALSLLPLPPKRSEDGKPGVRAAAVPGEAAAGAAAGATTATTTAAAATGRKLSSDPQGLQLTAKFLSPEDRTLKDHDE